MNLSTKSKYGLRAMLNLAVNYRTGPVKVSDIAKDEGISVAYLEQLLSKLRRTGLVKSARGPNGGYVLAKSPGAISVLDVVGALDKKIYPVSCVSFGRRASSKKCQRLNSCAAKLIWEKLANSISETLQAASLESLCREVKEKGS